MKPGSAVSAVPVGRGVLCSAWIAGCCLAGLAGLAAPAGLAVQAEAVAQQPQQVRVSLEADATRIHVGDPVSVRVGVEHPAGWSVLWPDSLVIAPFEALRYDFDEAVPNDGGVRSAATLVVTSFELGEIDIPPVPVPVARPDGVVDTLYTDPFRIGVESVGLDESGDIREIKGPLSIARSWWGTLVWLLLGLVFASAVFYAWRRRQKRSDPAPAPLPAAPPRPHHQVALEALDALESSSLLEQGRFKEYHIRISEIVRSYIEGQLEVRALEMATWEVVEGLRRAALGETICKSFDHFLSRCDLVKFAKLRPSQDASRAAMAEARELVKMTSGRAALAETA